MRVVQEHAGHIINGQDPPRNLVEDVSKNAIMQLGGVSAEMRVEASMSDLENYLLDHP